VAVVLYNSEPDQIFNCGKAVRHCADGTKSTCCNEPVKAAQSHTITVGWADLHSVAPHFPVGTVAPHVVDLWEGKTIPQPAVSSYTVKVAPSSTVLLHVKPVKTGV
jgi:hypothetical protein